MPGTDITALAELIDAMTTLVRLGPSLAPVPAAAAADTPAPLGWWVLICGEALDSGDFEQRERARESLARELGERGVRLNEFIWVWDETDTAQVVAARFPGQAHAERYARSLEILGLKVRVARERGE